jgi:hypothetical protein
MPFAVHHCIDLPFRPTVSMALSNRSQLRQDGRPGLRISARIPAGSANLRSATISLPPSLGPAAAGLQEICARREALAGNCPAGARLGAATARTPLLSEEMKGSVYAVQPRGSGTPDVWAELSGDGLRVNLKGQTKTEHGRTSATFAGMPDIALRSFSLRLSGGKRGFFKLSGDPCRSRGGLIARSRLDGQNSATASARIPVSMPAGCGNGG